MQAYHKVFAAFCKEMLFVLLWGSSKCIWYCTVLSWNWVLSFSAGLPQLSSARSVLQWIFSYLSAAKRVLSPNNYVLAQKHIIGHDWGCQVSQGRSKVGSCNPKKIGMGAPHIIGLLEQGCRFFVTPVISQNEDNENICPHKNIPSNPEPRNGHMKSMN